MTAVYIILGIILFFVLVFSVKISFELIYENKFTLTLKVLFFKIPLVPSNAKKKPKKDKKPKEEKPKEEKQTQETSKQSEKKENFVMKFYHDQGFDGTVIFIKDVLRILNTFMGDIFKRSLTIEKLLLRMRVSKGDAAETAIAYGKTCTAVFPSMGYICETMRVVRYDVDISPDYLANKSTASIHTVVSVRPIRITNVAVKFAFKAVIAFFKANKRGKERKKALINEEKNMNPIKNTEERNTL